MSTIQPASNRLPLASSGSEPARVEAAARPVKMATDQLVVSQGPMPRAVFTAKALSDDPAAEIDHQCTLLAAAKTRKQALAAVEVMKRELSDLKSDQSPQLKAYEAKVKAAIARAEAMPLQGAGPASAPAPRPTAKGPAAGATRPTITRAPASPTDAPTPEAEAHAKALRAGYMHASDGLPTPAFEALAAPDRATYLQLVDAADSSGQLALQSLLEHGVATPELLAALHTLATQALAPGLDRKALLSQTLDELADPSCIAQKARKTCSATCLQILVALREPRTYVALLQGLASPEGQAALHDGQALHRAADWDSATDGGRSLPSRLLQPALLELGNGPLHYDNARDADVDPTTHQASPSGLDTVAAGKLLGEVLVSAPVYDLLGPSYQASLLPAVVKGIDASITGPKELARVLGDAQVMDTSSQDRLVLAIAHSASPKDPVYCNVVYSVDGTTAYHAVLATGVKDGRVSFINPMGREESQAVDAFKRSLVALSVRKGDPTPRS